LVINGKKMRCCLVSGCTDRCKLSVEAQPVVPVKKNKKPKKKSKGAAVAGAGVAGVAVATTTTNTKADEQPEIASSEPKSSEPNVSLNSSLENIQLTDESDSDYEKE
jgi:hypothetical protein